MYMVTSIWLGKGSHGTDLSCFDTLLHQVPDLESQERDRKRKAPKDWDARGKAMVETSLGSLLLWLTQAPGIPT